jgi:hypothetical protein
VLWSPDKDKVITSFGNNGNSTFFSHDFGSNQSKKLPSGMDSVVWSSSGDRIIYKFYDPKAQKRSINISNSDGSNWTKLTDTDSKNVSLAMIPQSSLVAFWNSPTSSEPTTLDAVDTTGGATKTIFLGKFGADYLWSPSGDETLISSVDSKGGSKISLGTINKDGGNYIDLGVSTFASKCVWSKDGKTIYCAVPTFPDQDMTLPDDYLSGKISSQDTFFKIDLSTGKQQKITDLNNLNAAYDAQDLFLSSDESSLFFVNKLDGRLYRIDFGS